MEKSMQGRLTEAKTAFLKMSSLSVEQKNKALKRFAELILSCSSELLDANRKDLQEQQGLISASLYQRLELTSSKLKTLAQGLSDLTLLPDPAGQTQWRKKLDEGLVLERQSVPLGVLAVIFESRPDVIPQVLSLVLKSGNAAVLKGGKEALHSNRAFMKLVEQLNEEMEFLPSGWAQLIESREDVVDMLQYHDDIDLVIPRGSNQLVQYVMENTKIPVLGHADGVCHIYLDETYDLEQAVRLIIDSKAQYPSACNALETLLIKGTVLQEALHKLKPELKAHGIQVKGCGEVRKLWPEAEPVEDWHHEYSDLVLAIKAVSGLEEAIDHINRYGSHHTDAILSSEVKAQEVFLKQVDSASVFVNASTRFADGFRYGMGAEVGISTAKTHARGPVGLEGLVIYKYLLRGEGQIVAQYTGEQARQFLHQNLP